MRSALLVPWFILSWLADRRGYCWADIVVWKIIGDREWGKCDLCGYCGKEEKP